VPRPKKTSNGCVHQKSERIVSPKERRGNSAETVDMTCEL
jgi:hypothetical protein